MSDIEQAAAAVVSEWRSRPHSVIATALRRAIERLEAAIDAQAAAGNLQATHEQRTIDHEAWSKAFNGHGNPGEDAVTPGT